jgi:hypothetical protein
LTTVSNESKIQIGRIDFDRKGCRSERIQRPESTKTRDSFEDRGPQTKHEYFLTTVSNERKILICHIDFDRKGCSFSEFSARKAWKRATVSKIGTPKKSTSNFWRQFRTKARFKSAASSSIERVAVLANSAPGKHENMRQFQRSGPKKKNISNFWKQFRTNSRFQSAKSISMERVAF